MAIISLSQETFSNVVNDKATQAYNYLMNNYSTNFSRDTLLNNFYTDRAEKTNIKGEYAKNVAAQNVNDQRENELANDQRSRLPYSMLYALETLSAKTGITLYKLKNMHNEIYTSQPEKYWDNIAQQKFTDKDFQNAEFFKGRNRLTYLERLYQDNILGVMQRSLQNMHQNHEKVMRIIMLIFRKAITISTSIGTSALKTPAAQPKIL